MHWTFVQTEVFTVRWRKRCNDDALRALEDQLLANPAAGDPVPGCGLLRKLRFADPSRGKGKRGGLRVIYMLTPEASRVDLVTVYGKDEKDDLTTDELAAWCRLAKALRAQLVSQRRRP